MRLPILWLLLGFAATASAQCPLWFNAGTATSQASSLNVLNITAAAGGTPVTASLALNGPATCSALIDDPPYFETFNGNWLAITDTYSSSLNTLVYSFTADPTGLHAGQYLGAIVLQGSGFDNGIWAFPIIFTVTEPGADSAHLRSSLFLAAADPAICPDAAPGAPQLCSPTTGPIPIATTFEVGKNGAQAYAHTLTYSGSGAGSLPQVQSFIPTAIATPFWLTNVSVKPNPNGVPNNFILYSTVDSTNMPTGTYQGYISVNDYPLTSAYVVPYVLTVVPHAVNIVASPTTLSMKYTTGGTLSKYTSTLALSSTPTPANFSISGPDWVTISPSVSATNSTVTFTVNPNRLPPFASGQTTYTLTGTVTINNLSLPPGYSGSVPAKTTVPVSLTVTLGTPFSAGLYSTLGSINLVRDSANRPASILTVTTTIESKAGPAIPFTVASTTLPANNTWLKVSATSGTTPQALTFTLLATTDASGQGFVTLTPASSSIPPLVVPVTWTTVDKNQQQGAGPDAGISVSASALTFSTDPALSGPQFLQLTPLNNFPADATLYCTPYYLGSPANAWLTVNPINCLVSQPLAVAVDPTNLSPSDYAAIIVISDDAGDNLNFVGVGLSVLAPGAGSSALPKQPLVARAEGRAIIRSRPAVPHAPPVKIIR